MDKDFKAALLAATIISEQHKLTDQEREQIAESQKPIRAFCSILIDKYGHDAFRKMYVHDANTWEKAFEMVRKELSKSI